MGEGGGPAQRERKKTEGQSRPGGFMQKRNRKKKKGGDSCVEKKWGVEGHIMGA